MPCLTVTSTSRVKGHVYANSTEGIVTWWRAKKKCTHEPNKSRCSDNGANSIGQTTDTGGIKRDGRLKISLNCHDNGHRRHGGAVRCGAPRYAVHIIKRNYCRAVVNNALLLKRVPATARADTLRRADCVGKSRTRYVPRSLSYLRFVFRDWPWADLALSWRPGLARISCAKLATSPADSRDLALWRSRKKCISACSARCATRASSRLRCSAIVGLTQLLGATVWCGKAIFMLTSFD